MAHFRYKQEPTTAQSLQLHLRLVIIALVIF